MYTVIETSSFTQWIRSVRDRMTRIRLLRRIDRARRGLLGDCKPVGEGVWEMREDFGAGWRMYFCQREQTIVVLLGGGNKSSQAQDIEQAKAQAREMQHETNTNQAIRHGKLPR